MTSNLNWVVIESWQLIRSLSAIRTVVIFVDFVDSGHFVIFGSCCFWLLLLLPTHELQTKNVAGRQSVAVLLLLLNG